jgi:hypothetical protein
MRVPTAPAAATAASSVVSAIFGSALYLVNFEVFSPIAFETFEDANEPFELAAHIVFGLIVAIALFSSGARRQEPIVAMIRIVPASDCSPGARRQQAGGKDTPRTTVVPNLAELGAAPRCRVRRESLRSEPVPRPACAHRPSYGRRTSGPRHRRHRPRLTSTPRRTP